MNARTATITIGWALLCAVACLNATAADLSLDQVRSMLSSAAPSRPADFSGKDLSDLDLSRLDFRKANLRGVSFFGSKLVQSDFVKRRWSAPT
ncbi:MAG TPA: pentapeptide repeat-containing protein [Burkholderiaceae bacterium]|nr:pentapeptide repeat-containing protein [Burkholderiaceae bacterium]